MVLKTRPRAILKLQRLPWCGVFTLGDSSRLIRPLREGFPPIGFPSGGWAVRACPCLLFISRFRSVEGVREKPDRHGPRTAWQEGVAIRLASLEAKVSAHDLDRIPLWDDNRCAQKARVGHKDRRAVELGCRRWLGAIERIADWQWPQR